MDENTDRAQYRQLGERLQKAAAAASGMSENARDCKKAIDTLPLILADLPPLNPTEEERRGTAPPA